MNTRTACASADPALHEIIPQSDNDSMFTGLVPPSHLLLPVDFSNCTRPAIQYTLRVAAAFNARTTLLAMNPPPWIHTLADVTARPNGAGEDAGRRARQFVHRLLSSLGLEHDGRNLQLLIRNGEPARETILAATAGSADMIILAGLEKRALDIFRGGTAESVAHAAGRPVLTIRQEILVPIAAAGLPSSAQPWEHILAAVNFTSGGRSALACASRLALATRVRPTLLHVIESHPSSMKNLAPGGCRTSDATHERAARQLDELRGGYEWPVPPRLLVHAGLPVHEVITRMAARLQNDLLVTGMRRCHRVQHIISDDTTARLIGSAPCPVLVVPEDDR